MNVISAPSTLFRNESIAISRILLICGFSKNEKYRKVVMRRNQTVLATYQK